MPIVVPDLGERVLLRRMLTPESADSDPLYLRLYSNDYTPHRESLLADLTEATFSGYAPVALDPADWSAPVTTGGVAQTVHGPGVYSWVASSGTQDVYGYYVTDETDSYLLWAERYPSPVAVSATVPAVVFSLMRLRSIFQPEP